MLCIWIKKSTMPSFFPFRPTIPQFTFINFFYGSWSFGMLIAIVNTNTSLTMISLRFHTFVRKKFLNISLILATSRAYVLSRGLLGCLVLSRIRCLFKIITKYSKKNLSILDLSAPSTFYILSINCILPWL